VGKSEDIASWVGVSEIVETMGAGQKKKKKKKKKKKPKPGLDVQKCKKCGKKYNRTYSKCPFCGEPNPNQKI